MSKDKGHKHVLIVFREHWVLVYEKWLWNSLINIYIFCSIKNYSFECQLCMPDHHWPLTVSKIYSSFKGKVFVNIGYFQTWRAFQKGNSKMKNCIFTSLKYEHNSFECKSFWYEWQKMLRSRCDSVDEWMAQYFKQKRINILLLYWTYLF